MTTYVIPEQYAMAAAHGYRRGPGVKIGGGRALLGVRFGDEDEVVIIGQLSEENFEELQYIRKTSAGIPKMTYIYRDVPRTVVHA